MHVPFAARQHRRVGVTDRRVLRCGQQVEGAARDGGGQKKKDPLIRFHRGHSEVFIALILIRPATEALERHARETAERVYGWDAIAERQKHLYENLLT